MAYDVLTAWHERGVFANRVLDDLCRERRVSTADRALALDISYTVIRRQATLDAILSHFVTRPRRNVEDGLWRLLAMGVCQLVLLDGIPTHAAVHETAELSKQLQHPQWTAMINGTLRSVAKALLPDGSEFDLRRQVPVGLTAWCPLDRPVFADPAVDVAEYLAQAYSEPRWLVRTWLQQYGQEEATRLLRWFNVPSAPAIRVNLLRQSRDVVLQSLQAAGLCAEPGLTPESLVTTASFRPAEIPGFTEGWFSIQDQSAMAAARLLAPRPGDRVLDLCAAPGGKTTHLAELMQDTGTIVATDSDADRLQLVRQSAERLRLKSIETMAVSSNGAGLPTGPFDAALVDVPCSNTGVLGKRPEARWRVTPESIAELIPIQRRLLEQALARVKPGGVVVYSTCSIDPRENRGIVDLVRADRPDLALETELLHTPGRPADGGYQARLRCP